MNLTAEQLQTADAMTKVADLYVKIYPIIWTVLSMGNLVSFIVFMHKDMRRVPSNVYLSFLAVADMIYCCSPAWSGIHVALEGGLSPGNLRFWAKGKVWDYLIQASSILTGWLLVVISVDRFVMVFFPLFSKSRITVRNTLIFTSLTSLPFIIYPMHALFGRDGLEIFDGANNSHLTFAYKYISEEYEHFFFVTHLGVIAPAIHISIFIPMFALNSAVIYKLFKHARMQGKNLGMARTLDRETIRITIMLVTVSLIALLLRVPKVVSHIIAGEDYLKREMDDWWLAFWLLGFEVFYSLGYLNSCINFFIYISMSSMFKKHFMLVFFPCCKKEEKKKSLPPRRELPSATVATSVSATCDSGISNQNYM